MRSIPWPAGSTRSGRPEPECRTSTWPRWPVRTSPSLSWTHFAAKPWTRLRWRSSCTHKTAGNPFFVIQFLHVLAEEGLLVFDHQQARWSWDLDRIHAKQYTDNVADLMVGKLSRLPIEARGVLRAAGLPGNRAHTSTLSLVCQYARDRDPCASVGGCPAGVDRAHRALLRIRARSYPGSGVHPDPAGRARRRPIFASAGCSPHTPRRRSRKRRSSRS